MALTIQLEMILEEMNNGKYLIKMEDGESLSMSGYSSHMMVKKGSIDALLKEGLIFQALFETKTNIQRFRLTDDGRKYRKIK